MPSLFPQPHAIGITSGAQTFRMFRTRAKSRTRWPILAQQRNRADTSGRRQKTNSSDDRRFVGEIALATGPVNSDHCRRHRLSTELHRLRNRHWCGRGRERTFAAHNDLLSARPTFPWDASLSRNHWKFFLLVVLLGCRLRRTADSIRSTTATICHSRQGDVLLEHEWVLLVSKYDDAHESC